MLSGFVISARSSALFVRISRLFLFLVVTVREVCWFISVWRKFSFVVIVSCVVAFVVSSAFKLSIDRRSLSISRISFSCAFSCGRFGKVCVVNVVRRFRMCLRTSNIFGVEFRRKVCFAKL